MNVKQDLETRLKGSFQDDFFQEFFGNSIHFPLPNILVEMLRVGPWAYAAKIDPYFLVFGAVIQAWFMAKWQRAGHRLAPLGNLIGVGLYSLLELYLDGFSEYIENPNHRVYLTFSVAICLIQFARQELPALLTKLFTLAEHMVRTMIILAMYWVVEMRENPSLNNIPDFFDEEGHVYISLALLIIGLALGLTAVNSQVYLSLLRSTATELRKFSEWLFGRELLGAVFANQERLALKRTERSILFMDIRGFTSWAESRSPEEVVDLLNGYFAEVEEIWSQHMAIKVKHTADEIMVVFDRPARAYRAVFQARKITQKYLKNTGLSVGFGLHRGELVEGLIGSRDVKVYDIIGDTVNTAKRLCDSAQSWEILLSEAMSQRFKRIPSRSKIRNISAKGKKDLLLVYSF